MAEPTLRVRILALAVAVCLFAETTLAAAQAAPPPPPAAAPPAPPPAPAQQYPQQQYPQQQYPQQQYPQQQYPQQQPAPYPQPAPGAAEGAPPQGSFQPAPSPLYPPAQQGYAQPGYQLQPQRGWHPPRGPRTRKALMITGISILGGSYLLAIAVAGGLLDEDDDNLEDGYDDCEHCNDVAPWLFVPVVGPFIAMSETDDGDWGLWLLGMVQVVGTGLMIGGIIQYKNSKRAAQMQQYTRWKLPNDRELSLDVATSSRFAGPRVRLTF